MDTGPLKIDSVFGTTSGSRQVVKSRLNAVSGKQRRTFHVTSGTFTRTRTGLRRLSLSRSRLPSF